MNTQYRHNPRSAGGHWQRSFVTAAVAAVAAVALLITLVRGVGAQAAQPLVPGAPAAGNLTSRFGDAWTLYGCAGDVVTITAESVRFSPYIELYAAAEEAPLIEAGGDTTTTIIAGAPLTQTGLYTVAVLGERLSARGPYSLTATFAVSPALSTTATSSLETETPDGHVAAGQSVTGMLVSRFGDLWQMHLCGDVPVTVTMHAVAYAPVLELGPEVSGASAIVEDSGEDAESQWASIVFTPSHTLDPFLTVGGARRSDRGHYTLTVESGGLDALGTGSLPSIPTSTPSQRPSRTPQPTRQATATPLPIAVPSCRVLVQTLRLRSGPGTQYEPPLGGVSLDTALELLGRSADSGWVNVRVPDSGLMGWVSAGSQYVACNVPIGGLQVAAAPASPTTAPTATPTNTPRPTPTTPVTVIQPTPTSPVFVIVPGTGANGDVPGNLRTGLGIAGVEDGIMVFTRQIWFFADPQLPDGRDVDHVVFRIFGNEQNGGALDRTESTAKYCVFGGGEPNCNVLNLGAGAVWPDSGLPVLNDSYQVSTLIYLDGDDEENPSGSWFATFRIRSPDLPDAFVENTNTVPEEPTPPVEVPDIQVEAREFGPGSLDTFIQGQISFQVAAWDPAVGSNNGDGIESIILRIYGPSGLVHEREERAAAYCAFGGGEPDCTIYSYADNGYVWESGASVEPGAHTLTADVVADDGRTAYREWTVEIE